PDPGRRERRIGAALARGACRLRGAAVDRVAGGGPAHAGPGGCDLPRRTVQALRLPARGRALVRGPRPAGLQPAVPAARLAAGRARRRRARGAVLVRPVRAAVAGAVWARSGVG